MSDQAQEQNEQQATVGFYPLNPEQMGIYYAAMQNPEATQYNLPYLYRFDRDEAGNLIDAERLAETLRRLIAAHPYLMCNLVQKDGRIMAVKEAGRTPQVTLEDVDEEAARERIATFLCPFNLFKAPLYRAMLLRTSEHLYFLFDIHHIICDGTTLGLFLAELERIFAGDEPAAERTDGFELGLASERERESAAWTRGRDYYADLLGDGEAATALREGLKGEPENVDISLTVPAAPIFAAAEELAVLPGTYLAAIFALTLGKFERTRDVRMGMAYLGRETPDLFGTYGMLVRTLPYRLGFTGEQTVRELIAASQKAFSETVAASVFPLTEVNEAFDFEPSVVFNYLGKMLKGFSVGGFKAQETSLTASKISLFPCALHVSVEDETIHFMCSYDGGRITSELASALLESYAYLVVHLADHLDQRIAEVCVLSDAQAFELGQLNHRFFEDEPIDATKTAVSRFAEMVQTAPEKTALICTDHRYTYAELDAESNKLANRLVELGIKIEDPVALVLPRTSRVAISEIGIMKAGGAFIPIDPTYPKERVEHIVNDSGAPYLVVCAETAALAASLELTAAGTIQTLDIDEVLAAPDANGIPSPALSAIQAKLDGHNLAYIIYTSGSTGVPKGVQLEHHGLINCTVPLPTNPQYYALQEDDCAYAGIFTIAFDASVKDILGTLLNGRTFAMASSEQARNPIEYAKFVQENHCTATGATPSIAQALLSAPDVADALNQCRYMWIGAEKFPEALFDALKTAAPHLRIFNAYGPTECTIEANNKFMHRADEASIGAPINRCIEQIMDLDGNPLPVGVFGELYIGGDGVGRGYLNRPELNQRDFCEIDGIRYFKSGDLGMMYANGEIEVSGRKDSQVKFHGLRIELGEIEAACAAYPTVERAVVLIAPVLGVDQICCWFSASEKVNLIELKEHMATSLAPYMLPAAFLQLDEMPLTANGKLDRKALPAAVMLKESSFAAPVGPVETEICAAIAATLGVAQVGRDDSFFSIGGDSLSATELLVKLDELDYHITYADVFANPTPAELAALVTERDDVSAPVEETEESELAEASADLIVASAVEGADKEISGYDYAAIIHLLEQNTAERLVHESRRPLGNICLTGVTGYLGAHLLHEFIESYSGVAYLPVRAADDAAAVERIRQTLDFYFDGAGAELIGSRIVALAGSITDEAFYLHLRKFPIDTYLNSAALVKHFSATGDITEVNVGGTCAGLEFAQKNGCAFVQVSTVSVAGFSRSGVPDPNIRLTEQMLYFGQDLSNQYARSKFLAEREVLQAAAEGMSAKVIRVGNLMPRLADGRFQRNSDTNNFLKTFKAYRYVGKVPYSTLAEALEMSPVAYTAQAVLKLAQTPQHCSVFHAINNHVVTGADIVSVMNEHGLAIEACEDDEFNAALSTALHDELLAPTVSALIAYENGSDDVVVGLPYSSEFSTAALLRYGFSWPILTRDYIARYTDRLIALGYYDFPTS
ncbi:MAG: amino acid adenylation domain-containing protein [Coriobacteriales bacterium]|nr:amino acid adenylation domain-containing protein [Coriobacteriales bacterium]